VIREGFVPTTVLGNFGMADDNPHYRRASCEFPLFFLALAKIRVIINNYQFGGFPTCAATKPIKRFVEKIRGGKK
jgi:hypothetical protein